MSKSNIIVAAFLCGAIVTGGIFSLILNQYFPSDTEVWTTSSDLMLDGSIVIPSGVDLIHDESMPEGFVSLKLYVNVEGRALEKFQRRTESKRLFKIPYWVHDDGT